MSSHDEHGIRVERRGAVAWVVLNRPEKRNPLSADFTPRMLAILDELEDDASCRVMVLTGAGPSFCAGADLKRIVSTESIDLEQQFRVIRGFNRVTRRMRELDVPIIAAVNGPAVGGGAALVLACDLAVASERACLYFAFGRIGGTGADLGCSYLLPRVVGDMRARQLLMTGARVEANEAKEMGLFLEVSTPEDLEATAGRLAEQIIESSPRRATAATKMALLHGQSGDLGAALDYEAYLQTCMFQTDEHKQRLAAFLNSRGK